MTTYTFYVGAVKCTVIQDGGSPFTEERLTGMFANVPHDELFAAFNQTPEPRLNSMNCLLIETNGERIVVDTGLGAGAPPGMGCLLERLQGAGTTPSQVTMVMITHLHGDHYGGLLDSAGNPTFPNARYVIGRDEWNHWTQDSIMEQMGERAEGLRRCLDMMKPKLTYFAGGDRIVPGIQAVAVYGHTPGHLGVMVESEGQSLLALVDMLHSIIQFPHPDWSPRFDSQPDVSPMTRRAMLERAADSGTLTSFYHLPFPGLGHVVREGAAFAWQPV